MTQTIHEESGHLCMSRRQFLLSSGTAVTLAAVPGLAQAAAVKAGYKRQKVGKLSALMAGKPVEFAYPYADVRNILVKLGAPAGGGVGPEKDVVAFNQQCTHMGGPLDGTYKANSRRWAPARCT